MNNAQYAEDSDTSDEDYVPGGKQDDIPSEVDSDGEPEEPLTDSEESGCRSGKRKKVNKKSKITGKNKLEESDIKENKEDVVEENKNQNIDDIWADFMKDTGFKSKNALNVNSSSSSQSKTNNNAGSPSQSSNVNKSTEKVKITQIFEFAGEEVKVEKQVPVDSAEARLLSKSEVNDALKTSKGKRSGGLSGIGNVLSQLSKKPKISTLEKTKLDWDNFKKEHNIEEELQTHNKGKHGYLERQDFLQRADLRRFEIEKNVRAVERNKRFNSTL